MDNNKTSKKIKKTDLSLTVLLLIGILAVVNFFSYQLFLRWDLTQNKVYSISEASKRTVSELDDIVNVKAYFSEGLPSQVLSLKQEVGDILDEYATFSGGKVRVEFIDPQGDETLERELVMIGIPQLTFEVYEKDNLQYVNGYMGIAISHGGKTEVIPAVKQDTSDLEYQLTTAIKKVIVDEIATVGFLTSHGTVSSEEIKAARTELEKLYTVRELELAEENPEVPSDIDTLIIVGPKESFSEDDLRAINSFLARGGSLLALLNGVEVGEGLMASKNNSTLDSLFEKYGIKVNKDLVADTRRGIISYTQGNFPFPVRAEYAYWPRITSEAFNQDNGSVANLENIILPWASSIEILPDKISEESVSTLFTTSENGWLVQDNFNIGPNIPISPQGEQKKYILAVAVNEGLKDAYPDEEEGGLLSGRLIIISDSDFIADGILRGNPDNLTLFQNLVDSLSFDEDLINIRSKIVSSRPVKESLTDGEKAGIKFINIFAVTIAVIAFGMFRYFMRRRSRFIDDL